MDDNYNIATNKKQDMATPVFEFMLLRPSNTFWTPYTFSKYIFYSSIRWEKDNGWRDQIHAIDINIFVAADIDIYRSTRFPEPQGNDAITGSAQLLTAYSVNENLDCKSLYRIWIQNVISSLHRILVILWNVIKLN